MLTSFKIKCRIDIEATISLPPTGYFVRNSKAMRLCYNIGSEIKYINLASQEEAVKFLKKHGVISPMSHCKNNEVKMYRPTLVTEVGAANEPVQRVKLLPVQWNEIELTRGQVITFAAAYEIEQNPLIKKFINQYFKTAA